MKDLLLCHQSEVLHSDPTETFRFKVRRKFIWEDVVHELRLGFDFRKHIRVTFVAEPAIDVGGPKRELLRLLMNAIISNNSLFEGHMESRFLRHNIIELKKKTYFYIGQVLALSLVHGGPTPSFFAKPVAQYIINGLDKVEANIYDIQDSDLREKLTKVIASVPFLQRKLYISQLSITKPISI